MRSEHMGVTGQPRKMAKGWAAEHPGTIHESRSAYGNEKGESKAN